MKKSITVRNIGKTLGGKRILEDMNIKISKIASGIPMGADIEYLDVLTLERALKDRTTL